MRKMLAPVLVLVIVCLSVPTMGSAQSLGAAQLGTISGQTVDAGGRGLAGQRVELVRAGQTVQTTTSGSRGEWSFSNLPADEYIVRTTINGQVAGTRVSVTAGQLVKTVIVAPSSAVASPAFLAGLGLLGGMMVVAAVVAVVVATVVATNGS